MLSKFKALRSQLNAEDGFTLIELMIVVVIIGILTAVAIPVFSQQQKAALDVGVQNDVRNSNLAVQTWITQHPNTNDFVWEEIAALNNHTTDNTVINLFGRPSDYCIKAFNPDALQYNSNSGPYFIFISAQGKYGSTVKLRTANQNSCGVEILERGNI